MCGWGSKLQRLVATGAVGAAALIACAAASAAEVSVEERRWTPAVPPPPSYVATDTTNRAVLVFAAAAGEQNRVTVTEAARSGDSVSLQVTDPGTALSAGPGCDGGGSPGSPVVCTIPAPRYPKAIFCGKSCVRYEPGSGWIASMRVELGDGNDSFDGSSFRGEYPDRYAELVRGGGGDDRISTGSGDDEIDPGAGQDEVYGGDGRERVFATATADGADLYDLGADGFDIVSYESRTEPVEADPNGGGEAGEHDRFAGVELLIGGSGDDILLGTTGLLGGPGADRLSGSEERNWIFGGDGDDVLRGGGGDDEVDGEDGNDFLNGEGGDDRLRENPRRTDGDNLSLVEAAFGSTTGADFGRGGDGHDIIDLGPGDDVELGGDGGDWIYGGSGQDAARGGPGPDILAGEAGIDRTWGGGGDDLIRSGRNEEHWYTHPPQPLDPWSDRVDCGGGHDRASANPWDRLRRCEERSPLPTAGFGTPRLDPLAGTARLPLRTIGPGRLVVTGRGVSPLEIELDEGPHTRKHPLLVDISARGGALEALRRRGHVNLRVIVRLVPAEGPTRQAGTDVRLVLSRSKR